MLIACVQSDVTFASPQANLTRVVAWMEQTASAATTESTNNSLNSSTIRPRQAELIVFPECMLSGYTFASRQDALAAAIAIHDPIFDTLAQKANDLGQWIVLGFLERDDDKLYNASALVGPQGVVACYRKIHLPGLGVDQFVDRGDRPYQPQKIETPQDGSVNIGLAICYDGSFPEPIRVLGLGGAEIIALSTNWPIEGQHASQIVPPARSMENHLFFVASNRIGIENEVKFCGRSSICGPDGVVLASCDHDHETILFADVDIRQARNKSITRCEGSHVIDRFADRRPEFYRKIIDQTSTARRGKFRS